MQIAQTRLRRSKRIALCLAVMLGAFVFSPANTAFATVESVKSPDGTIAYPNGGFTYVTSDTTVLVAHAPVDVFYSFAHSAWTDVYYDDAAGQPNGSYFPGNQNPAVNGGFVTNFGAPAAANGGVALGADSLITIPIPGNGGRTTLTISTYSNGVLQDVYAHTFISFLGTLALDGDQSGVHLKFNNDSKENVEVTIILAAYDAKGRLLSMSSPAASGSVAPARGSISHSVGKMAGAAYYKAYAWYADTYIPLLPSVTLDV